METINNLCKIVHANAIEKGFYENGKATNMGERIALIHSECSEALEADRNGKYSRYDPFLMINIQSDKTFFDEYTHHIKGTFEEEIADIVIRAMDMAEFKKMNLESHILAKIRYNSMREKYHGKKY